MKIYLYGKSFEITESNICEGRGKYLIRTSTKNADKFIKNECEKCQSVSEMIQQIPKITGSLIGKVIQHMLYILRQEGISTNGKSYVESVFNAKESVCQKFCQDLYSRTESQEHISDSQLDEIYDQMTEAALLDIENLWIGYFVAHGYSAEEEFYTHEKLKNAISDLALLSINKKGSPTKVCIQALCDAPYEESVYKTVESYIGLDKSLNFYRSLFMSPFKPGSYKDMLSPQELEVLKVEIARRIYALANLPECKFKMYVYYYSSYDKKVFKKFTNAINYYAKIDEQSEIPLVCLDTTVMGGAEDGMLISTKGIYVHNSYESGSLFFHFNDIKSLKFNSKNIFINDKKINIGAMSSSDIDRFCTLINTICYMVTPLYETERVRSSAR